MDTNRLKRIIEDSNLTKVQIAEKCGFTRVTLNKLLEGADVKLSTIESLAKVLNVSTSYLLSDADTDTSHLVKLPKEEKCITEYTEEQTRPRIPQTVAAGYLTGFADAVSKNDCEMVQVCKRLPDYDYTIIVKGDSMEPKFEGGDEIAIKKVYSVVEGGKAYVLDTRDGAILKRLYDEGDTFRCVSYNNEYQDFHINKSDIFGIYRVVGLIRI